ncbi:hypothetical protein M0D69_07295 [Caballeronia sp. SEWSISQ10-4 2]|uniref:hypothetical protein n=1 Tax=Caballeronia sp. SEWSISQ10-4 2 TaxID=2937438 RepID=UPI0026566307|nr:hypothetical protein [Caballeronia sp. SEWSISQ10-4 2]MDN7177826.1 hypothetical protein [Caballeronia sp. SEWSISQ10-4 2]
MNQVIGVSYVAPYVVTGKYISHRKHTCYGLTLTKADNGLDQFQTCVSQSLQDATAMVALRSVIARFRPDIVVTGTSIRTKVEHTIWAVAQKLDIRTFAMIDGWAKISDRFPQKLSTRAMPYRVGVVDQQPCGVGARQVPHAQRK